MRWTRLRPLLVAAAAGIALAGVAVVAPTANGATDPTLDATYPVTGTTSIAATNSSLSLGPGTLEAVLDLNTLDFTGNLSLPNSTGTFKALGFVPVTATAQFIQDGPITGQDVEGAIVATSHISIRLTKVVAGGIPLIIGPICQTTPAEIDLASGAGFNVLTGGPVSGTFTIPNFQNCGFNTGLINAQIPGPGNDISLTLGTPTIVSNTGS
jgi:hypothetical protein